MVAKALERRPLAHNLGSHARRLIDLGTSGYPPKIRRRLRNINVGCYTIAVSCALFALTFALEDAARYRGAIIINLAMMAAALSAPIWHRIHDVAGALFVAFALLFGLFGIVALVGRDSGIQINFIAASAVAFLIDDIRRLRFIALVILVAIALHIASWLLFPEGTLPGWPDRQFLLRLYLTTVVTISIIIAVLVYYAFRTAAQAEAETEALLHLILPASVAERLKENPGEPISDSFDQAAVLFSDLVGFVPIARSLGAERTVAMLNHLVSGFDRLAGEHGIAKIKTIGDAYMAVAGVPRAAADDAVRLARMALKMQGAADATAAEFAVGLRLRIGIALGPVMAGVIGTERFSYDVWGDAVNLAARLENTGEAGKIQVSQAFREALAEEFAFARRGATEIKGVGREDTWFLIGNVRDNSAA